MKSVGMHVSNADVHPHTIRAQRDFTSHQHSSDTCTRWHMVWCQKKFVYWAWLSMTRSHLPNKFKCTAIPVY